VAYFLGHPVALQGTLNTHFAHVRPRQQFITISRSHQVAGDYHSFQCSCAARKDGPVYNNS